jgi:hypothetical protein
MWTGCLTFATVLQRAPKMSELLPLSMVVRWTFVFPLFWPNLADEAIEILKLTPLRLAGVPPPMAQCEVTLDSNIVDVSFSLSGSRIAVLTKSDFSVFTWSLKGRPVPCPVLESSHPLPEAPGSRPRQILFLRENEVYILINCKPGQCQIQCTALTTLTTKIAYQTTPVEHIHSIFSSLGHEMLWLSHTHEPGNLISCSTIVPRSEDVHVLKMNFSLLDGRMALPLTLFGRRQFSRQMMMR